MISTRRASRTAAATLLAWTAGAGVAAGGDAVEPDAVPERLLARLSRVAELYLDSALDFTCDEITSWDGPGLRAGRVRLAYVFRYREERGFEDYRTWPGQAVSRLRETHPSQHGAPAFVGNAYLWILAFRESRQARHRYRIAGEGTRLGRPAIAIEFEPVPPVLQRVNDWFGTAWIDRDTAQPLEVEASTPENHERAEALARALRGEQRPTGPYDIERITTKFTIERNGMRFPGRVLLRRARHLVRGSPGRRRVVERLIHEVEQVYRRCRFFHVRSEGQVRAWVDPEGEPRTPAPDSDR